MKRVAVAVLALMGMSMWNPAMAADEWRPVEGHILTRWAADVDPTDPWPEYPRPKMVRPDWLNLNGLWDYAVTSKDTQVSGFPPKADQPPAGRFSAGGGSASGGQPSEKILVPFCIESALSGVGKELGRDKALWYRRTFEVPPKWNERVLLHFGAVDWECTVWVNGTPVGSHQGGYDPFSFDITEALQDGANEVVLRVWDPTSDGTQPRGKQLTVPNGIWYTPVSGIWQTVWLEPVPERHIERLHIVPDIDAETMTLRIQVAGDAKAWVWAKARDGKTVIAKTKGLAGEAMELKLPRPKLWSPDSPFLYDLEVGVEGGDRVESYFGMRKIALAKDDQGVPRIELNNELIFQYGPLDQGWWPDGLYTPATEEALRYDLEVTQQLGMNMVRKHVKVELERFYSHCDRMGLLVWQDMPSGNFETDKTGQKQYRVELERMIAHLHHYPSIVMWVPFNEGWGQHDTEAVAAWVKELDPSRLVNEASGWHDKGSGDVRDLHQYTGPGMPELEERRAAVLGEFGGLGLPVKGHLWSDKRNWGYKNLHNRQALQHDYDTLIHRMRPMIAQGLCAAVYTQTSDVEGEVNGLLTYDREILKLDADHAAALHACLYDPGKELPPITTKPPPPTVTVIVPTSEQKGQTWRYTTDAPPADWMQSTFDDTAWKTGTGMFGTEGTPGTRIETEWSSSGIWMRRTFELQAIASEAMLRIFHDEDVEVYINGKRVKSLHGYTVRFINVSMDASDVLRVGENTLAVHCRQSSGGQGIDVGLVELEESKP